MIFQGSLFFIYLQPQGRLQNECSSARWSYYILSDFIEIISRSQFWMSPRTWKLSGSELRWISSVWCSRSFVSGKECSRRGFSSLSRAVFQDLLAGGWQSLLQLRHSFQPLLCCHGHIQPRLQTLHRACLLSAVQDDQGRASSYLSCASFSAMKAWCDQWQNCSDSFK